METTKRSFRAARQLKLHQRCVDVLDMIVTCDKNYADAADYLAKYDRAGWLDIIKCVHRRDDLEAEVNRYAAIKQRLTLWYIDIMSRIEQVAILHVQQNENY